MKEKFVKLGIIALGLCAVYSYGFVSAIIMPEVDIFKAYIVGLATLLLVVLLNGISIRPIFSYLKKRKTNKGTINTVE